MSKIYEALEKAERERQRAVRKEPPPITEFQQIEGPRQDIGIEPKRVRVPVSKELLVSYFQPRSLGGEQIRKLRTYILRRHSPSAPRTIMVTSAMSEEGKTFVSANLAASIASDLNTEALLVDCDLRTPSLSKWFDVPKSRGLSDYLGGNGTSYSEFVITTQLEKLRVLPAGTSGDNPTELVGSKRMESLVRELRSHQEDRYIIFDSTPVLATTEPEVLGRFVDGIILVVRAGFTPRETVQQAVRSLESGKIIGVVLNEITFRSPGLQSRYFGSAGYGYYECGYGKKNRESEKNRERLFRWLPLWNREKQ